MPEPAPPLGLGAMSDDAYTAATFPFHEGDRILLHTDGVTETRDREGTFYPLAERVLRWADRAPRSLLKELTTDLRAYAGGPLDDDMAMMVVQRGPEAA
ncbi:SpoIIE family protein phosphatase [Streptomyces sp. NPDC001848]|uniref:SpoIIE family protein phosphatase n=1 Tax=Streptomyces sp. NPDC001848 TaxID=3364618 RepID=UPI003683C998